MLFDDFPLLYIHARDADLTASLHSHDVEVEDFLPLFVEADLP
jgi:hypothetical protein